MKKPSAKQLKAFEGSKADKKADAKGAMKMAKKGKKGE